MNTREGPHGVEPHLLNYCLGFAFDLDKEHVLLIEKTKPANQRGRLNGVGGKIEGMEIPVAAMVREFEEEVTVKTTRDSWEYRGQMFSPRWRIAVYMTHMKLEPWVSPTEEKLEIVRVDNLWKEPRLLFNLRWMIPLCLDIDTAPFTVQHY